MKEPKFRGFNLETNKWYYGHGWFEADYTNEFLEEKGIAQQAVLHTDSYPVECELSSMGQYRGLKDKYQNKVFNKDLIKYTRKIYTDCSRKEVEKTFPPIIGELYYAEGLYPAIRDSNGLGHIFMPGMLHSDEIEVIGNAYERS